MMRVNAKKSGVLTPANAGVVAGVLALFAAGGIAWAATSATVAATVTVQNISIGVSSGTVAYGILANNTSKSTISGDLGDTQSATNTGNVAEDFSIKGQNSTAWTLAGSTGSDQYVHKFCSASCGSPPTNFTALTTSFQALASNVAVNGSQNFDLQITTPNPSTAFTQQSVDVTVLAAAH